jgi:hypothetical protein
MSSTLTLVIAPEHLISVAKEILRMPHDVEPWPAIQMVALALIAETATMTRAVTNHAARARVRTSPLSPPEMVARAEAIQDVALDDADLQAKARMVVNGYLRMAMENEKLMLPNLTAFSSFLPGVELKCLE